MPLDYTIYLTFTYIKKVQYFFLTRFLLKTPMARVSCP